MYSWVGNASDINIDARTPPSRGTQYVPQMAYAVKANYLGIIASVLSAALRT